METSLPGSVMVLACGNANRGDDAFGPMVIEALIRLGLEQIKAVNLGPRPDRLLDYLDVQTLIIVDAVEHPDLAAGTIVELDEAAILRLPDRPGGTHGFSWPAQLQLANRLGSLPATVRFIGVAIGQTNREARPGQFIASRISEVVDRIVRMVRPRIKKERLTP